MEREITLCSDFILTPTFPLLQLLNQLLDGRDFHQTYNHIKFLKGEKPSFVGMAETCHQFMLLTLGCTGC